MARLLVLAAAAVCLALASATPSAPIVEDFYPFPCPVRQEVYSCRNFCEIGGIDQRGEYSCCDEDDGPSSHRGSCPNTRLTLKESNLVCDFFEPPVNFFCEYDSDCARDEKCCFTLDTQHQICRKAVY